MSLSTPETSPKHPVYVPERSSAVSQLQHSLNLCGPTQRTWDLQSPLGLWFVVLVLPNCWPVRIASSGEKMGSYRIWGLQPWDYAVRCVAKGFLRAWRLKGGYFIRWRLGDPHHCKRWKREWCSAVMALFHPCTRPTAFVIPLFVTLDISHLQTKGLPHHLHSRNKRFYYRLTSTSPRSIVISFGLYREGYSAEWEKFKSSPKTCEAKFYCVMPLPSITQRWSWSRWVWGEGSYPFPGVFRHFHWCYPLILP